MQIMCERKKNYMPKRKEMQEKEGCRNKILRLEIKNVAKTKKYQMAIRHRNKYCTTMESLRNHKILQLLDLALASVLSIYAIDK